MPETINIAPADGAYTTEMLNLKHFIEKCLQLESEHEGNDERLGYMFRMTMRSRNSQLRSDMRELLSRDILVKAGVMPKVNRR